MRTPSITPAQIIATVTAVVGLLVTQGAITNGTGKVIGGLASILVPFAWMLADAIIRHGRSRALMPVSQPVAVPVPVPASKVAPPPPPPRRRPTKRPS